MTLLDPIYAAGGRMQRSYSWQKGALTDPQHARNCPLLAPLVLSCPRASLAPTPPPPPHPTMHRYTGYVQGLHETFKKTPVMAQLETKAPGPSSFLHTRTARPPVASPHRVSELSAGYNSVLVALRCCVLCSLPFGQVFQPRCAPRCLHACCVAPP
jgi:hypothetical protein